MDADNNIFSMLMKLEKEVLVKILLDSSKRHEDVSNAIDRLIFDKKTIRDSFVLRLKDYKTDGEFYRWDQTLKFARELDDLLLDLEEGVTSPKEAIELLKLFFEADGDIINNCDDSSGYIGSIFNGKATELFESHASQCNDKDWLSNIFFDLIIHNDYGLRDELTNNVGNFLPEKNMRVLVDRLWGLRNQDKDNRGLITNEVILLQKMAKGLKDPILFEKIIREEGGYNQDYDNFRLGEMYYECGDYQKAISFLEKVEKSSSCYRNCDDLLLSAYMQVGDVKKQKEMAWDIFRGHRTKENFNVVIEIEGHSKFQVLLRQEIEFIFQEKELKNQNVDFLFEMQLFDEAENYVFDRRSELDGGYFGHLIEWAEMFEEQKKFLVASLVYRALLDSILVRAYSKAYHHGVDYLKKLEKYAEKIQDWKGSENHHSYLGKLMSDHKRKHGFWSQYRSGNK